MRQTTEEFFTGYCKAHNMTQVISCEYSWDGESWSLEAIDCDFERCVHSKTCDVVKRALEKEDE
ncbi:MAG: ubiquinone biosynthesis protein UbiE [Lachnospiraceae bacterium]|nr:ubiquinone biosynthesis protein UbiE [Lachnospiraceae bacterium]